jgi:hypothetical protein
MTDGPENFDQLRTLLKLKRYEQAPPGYFNSLPGRIIVRIEREGSLAHQSWFARLRLVLSENPITSGIFAVCGILMVVIGNSQYLDQYVAAETDPAMAMAVNQLGGMNPVDNEPEALGHSGLKVVSAQDALVPGTYPAALFGPMDSSLSAFPASAQPVSFNFSR